jgi:hypothetical protein
MGFYGGTRGRLVWRSADQPGQQQADAVVDPVTHMAEAPWKTSLVIRPDGDWPPGSYLLKLVTNGGAAGYVPLVVRDPAAVATFVVIDPVTTWLAYNDWGACSLYNCLVRPGPRRAVVVSFDRPYFHPYGNGAADFVAQQLPLVALIESLGYDDSAVTDLDLDADPSLALGGRAVISMGHDEYYSLAMRTALTAARDHGVNLLFSGANAVYRKIRLEPGADGRPARRMVNYRASRFDPGAVDLPTSTVEWRAPPVNQPEASLVGVQYECEPVDAALVISNPGHWIFAGTGVVAGQRFDHLVGNEYDRAVRASPAGLQVLTASPVRCANRRSVASAAYYEASSGAGVFATGTLWWTCALDRCKGSDAVAFVRRSTANVLAVFGAGPAATVPKPTN